jgi:HPt (histidine-containing phosphotransfer) domain-containing protein
MVAVARVQGQPPSPALSVGPIDLQHLSRMTLGELSLQREVLALFERQADILLRRVRRGAPALAAAAAHTLKGSAAGIGAFEVAEAAAAVQQAKEQGEARSNDATAAAAIEILAAVLQEARAEIARLLQTI